MLNSENYLCAVDCNLMSGDDYFRCTTNCFPAFGFILSLNFLCVPFSFPEKENIKLSMFLKYYIISFSRELKEEVEYY